MLEHPCYNDCEITELQCQYSNLNFTSFISLKSGFTFKFLQKRIMYVANLVRYKSCVGLFTQNYVTKKIKNKERKMNKENKISNSLMIFSFFRLLLAERFFVFSKLTNILIVLIKKCISRLPFVTKNKITQEIIFYFFINDLFFLFPHFYISLSRFFTS